jgi:hypothetical protein
MIYWLVEQACERPLILQLGVCILSSLTVDITLPTESKEVSDDWVNALKKEFHYTVPRLAVSKNLPSLQQLAKLAKLTGGVSELVIVYAADILAFIFLHDFTDSSTEFNGSKNVSREDVIQFLLEAASKSSEDSDVTILISFEQLLRSCLQKLVIRMCLALGNSKNPSTSKSSNRRERALRALENIRSIVQDSSDGQGKNMSQFLLNFFLGTLHHITNDLIASSVSPTADKVQAINALAQIIEHIGPAIRPFLTQASIKLRILFFLYG